MPELYVPVMPDWSTKTSSSPVWRVPPMIATCALSSWVESGSSMVSPPSTTTGDPSSVNVGVPDEVVVTAAASLSGVTTNLTVPEALPPRPSSTEYVASSWPWKSWAGV